MGLGNGLKSPFWTPKLIFQFFDLPVFSVFVQNSLFGSQNSRSILYNMFIWTTRTIFVFGKKWSWYGKTLPKKEFWGKVTFWDYRENELIHWRYILKSPPMLGCSRRGFISDKLTFLEIWDMPILEKCAFPYISWLFKFILGETVKTHVFRHINSNT